MPNKLNKYKRFGKNTLYVAIGNVGSKLISFIMLPFYTKWLSPEKFGETDVINVYASLLLSFSSCCIADALFVLPKTASENERRGFFSSGILFVFLMLCLMALLIVLFDGMNLFIYGDVVLRKDYWLIYAMMLSQLLQNVTQSFARAIDKMLVYGITGVINTGTIAFLSFIFVPSYGIYGYVLAIAVAHFVSAIYTFIFSKSYTYFSFREIKLHSVKTLLKYSMPLLPSSIMWWLVNGINKPVIAKYIGMAGNGILAVSNKLPAIVVMLFIIIANSTTISVMEEYGKKGFVHFFDNCLKILLIPTIFSSCFLAIFSKPIISIVANDAYIDAYIYMPFCVLGSIFSCLGSLIGTIFAAKKTSIYFFYSSAIGAIVSVITIFTLIPKFGLYGAVASVILSFVSIFIARVTFAWKDINGIDIKFILYQIFSYTIISIVAVSSLNIYTKITLYIFVLFGLVLKCRHFFSKIIALIKGIIR